MLQLTCAFTIFDHGILIYRKYLANVSFYREIVRQFYEAFYQLKLKLYVSLF